MKPETLAALQARSMDVPGPWSACEFSDLQASPGVFLAKPPQDLRAPRGKGPDETSMRFHGFALGRVAADEAELLTIPLIPDIGDRAWATHAAQPSRQSEIAWRRASLP